MGIINISWNLYFLLWIFYSQKYNSQPSTIQHPLLSFSQQIQKWIFLSIWHCRCQWLSFIFIQIKLSLLYCFLLFIKLLSSQYLCLGMITLNIIYFLLIILIVLLTRYHLDTSCLQELYVCLNMRHNFQIHQVSDRRISFSIHRSSFLKTYKLY